MGANTKPTSAAERFEWGRSLQDIVPLDDHAQLGDHSGRDPIDLISSQEANRLGFLIPLRRQRMGTSAFAFYRGSAVVQAADLAATPTAGIEVQLCGDAHLSNFGLYGSPERRLVFDVNDFDETLPGPFEWDVKRLAASFVLAGRDKGHEESDNVKAARSAAAAYRRTVAQFSSSRYIDAWYAEVDGDMLQGQLQAAAKGKKGSNSPSKMLDRARSKDCLRALSKLAVNVDGRYQIKSDPPNIVPLKELTSGRPAEEIREMVDTMLRRYSESLPDSRSALLNRYQLIDVALKVVGVGSVGTRCFIGLFRGRDSADPLFLQIKEAGRSVLESHLPASRYDHAGQRVVEGQQLMQAASDIFLGWTRETGTDRDYYVRQMWDMKGSVDFESFTPKQLREYAIACGWTLAHAHCRTGSASSIAGYLGEDDAFEKAIAGYAAAYANLAEADYAAFRSTSSRRTATPK